MKTEHVNIRHLQIWALFCMIVFFVALSLSRNFDVVWLLVLVPVLALVVAIPFVLSSRIAYRRWLPRYEEWKRTSSTMGLKEIERTIIGNYRNHNVTIDEIDLGDKDSPILKTRYRIALENPQKILLYIEKRFTSGSTGASLPNKYIQDIHFDDSQFRQGLVIKGNKEKYIQSILDSSIQKEIMNIKSTLHELEIGYGKPLGTSVEIEIEPNAFRYVDSQSLTCIKGNAVKFQLILDTLIDIVEKIEASS